MEIKKVKGIFLSYDFSCMSTFNAKNNTLRCQCRFMVKNEMDVEETNALCALAAKAASGKVANVIFDFTTLTDAAGKPFTEATAGALLTTMLGQSLPLSIGYISIANDLCDTAKYTTTINGNVAPITILSKTEVGHNMVETGLLEWGRNNLAKRVANGTLTKVEA